jgi:uroporphyrinogen decarboxylase
MFHKLVDPYLSERIKRTKEIAKCYYWHHSCGSVTALIEELITCRVNILNPVQTSATGIKPEILKQCLGNRLIFWGGIYTRQSFLNSVIVEEVRGEVKRIVKILGKDGGYVFAPAHDMQDDVPPENIIAMIESVRTAM